MFQVFSFGSVPLKTYLPDGDIDLTAISDLHRFNDTWASDMSALLEHEEHNQNSEFHVKEVKCIYAEV
jgi:DNA polymerase sigma